ncbi:hypothetical protein ACNAN0_05320 [Agrilactobacillus fermenti]|uniref:hypothetical protein n=1 Tax=Agrilactobacillus fermenti TaxID=2586909 RepID=UPI003A5BEE2E
MAQIKKGLGLCFFFSFCLWLLFQNSGFVTAASMQPSQLNNSISQLLRMNTVALSAVSRTRNNSQRSVQKPLLFQSADDDSSKHNGGLTIMVNYVDENGKALKPAKPMYDVAGGLMGVHNNPVIINYTKDSTDKGSADDNGTYVLSQINRYSDDINGVYTTQRFMPNDTQKSIITKTTMTDPDDANRQVPAVNIELSIPSYEFRPTALTFVYRKKKIA